MRIGVIVERRYLSQNMPGAVIRAFRERGFGSDILCPQGSCFDPATGGLQTEDGRRLDLNDYDVIVSRNRKPLGLAMLRYAEVARIPAVNTHTSTQRVRNKAKMATALGQAGVPCPPTFLAEDASVLGNLPKECFPLILKATYGDNSQGLRLVRRPGELGDIHWGNGLVLAQHYLPNDGFDLKLYVCGRTVFAVRKPSPFNGNPDDSPQPVEPDASMVDLALRCGETFGLDVYGVDTIETPDGLAVIEVNEFPNFTGVPGAGDQIADYILDRVNGKPERFDADRVHSARVRA